MFVKLLILAMFPLLLSPQRPCVCARTVGNCCPAPRTVDEAPTTEDDHRGCRHRHESVRTPPDPTAPVPPTTPSHRDPIHDPRCPAVDADLDAGLSNHQAVCVVVPEGGMLPPAAFAASAAGPPSEPLIPFDSSRPPLFLLLLSLRN